MEKTEAIKILIQVAELAQKSGILSLKDAVVVSQSVETLLVEESKDIVTDKELI